MSQIPPSAPPDKPAKPPAKPKSRDVVLMHSPTEDRQGVRVIRARDGNLEAGEMRPLREGASLQGTEVVKLKEREGSPVLWDVEVEYDGRESASTSHAGPPRVASRAYRQNYDGIFRSKRADSDVN